MSYTRIRYDRPADNIARITLARPEVRNAQDFTMLYEIDAALTEAGKDHDVKVVILAADGVDFSAGHDLDFDMETVKDSFTDTVVHQTVGTGLPGIEGWMPVECDAYVGLCQRWRDFPKPLIAQVQGRVIAAGLMLVWPCDLIVASRDASFRDPVVAFGVNGHEYFVHPWEWGHRKAKELLFTGNAMDAEEARQIGMVNHIVERDELEDFTLDLARQVATRPMFGLKLAKMSVNAALDAQGQTDAVKAAFAYHQLGHANAFHRFGYVMDPDGPALVRAEIRAQSANRQEAR
ncbi:enoyl-CoA hydratase/isomerase family protein [Nocardia nova SH22a]|uniref:Enoyl-CoA hydratase/isomerase family protein n=1 Tax=Nocardia nova SH22a TaxID=1415166 RepID=W5THX2_9NOCA|nr:enoyl-CoA hydratase [Nocardia nova]AHH18593.1 enoyl-CoA hydratase/isomerase family protein [Nocardia nova SH22a]